MRKFLICLLSVAALGGCSKENIPWVHKIDVQQGNMITQELVDQLKPGMSKGQVRYTLGSPMLIDLFHQERWDYIYTFTPGGGEPTERRVTLYFKGDQLDRLEGDYRPRAGAQAAEPPKERTIEVPAEALKRDKGWWEKVKGSFGSDDPAAALQPAAEEPAQPTATPADAEPQPAPGTGEGASPAAPADDSAPAANP